MKKYLILPIIAFFLLQLAPAGISCIRDKGGNPVEPPATGPIESHRLRSGIIET
jgi:hypothetical protein